MLERFDDIEVRAVVLVKMTPDNELILEQPAETLEPEDIWA